MSESLEDFRARVNSWARVPQGPAKVLTDDQIDEGIQAAVKDYSVKAGLKQTIALSGSGPEYVLPTLVTGWSKGWQIEEVLTECEQQGFRTVDPSRWRLIRRGTTESLWTRVASPWIAILSPHVLAATAGDTTLPLQDLSLVAKLAAAYAIKMHAAEAGDTTSSTIVGDGINYQSILDQLLKMAAEYEKDFREWVQARYGGGAFATTEWDIRNSTGRMLMHGSDRW